MFYENVVVSLNITNTHGKQGKDGGKFINNFLNIASKFKKTLVISINFWLKFWFELIGKSSQIMTILGKFQKYMP